MHLTTTAKGLPEIYNHGNEARYENVDEAKALDDVTQ